MKEYTELPSRIAAQVRPAVVILVFLTLVTGICYPLLITAIAQVAFPVQANGDLLIHNGKVAGSALIGQPFSSPKYFWGRPSATTPGPYNAGHSSGSNLGPSNIALTDAVKARVAILHLADPSNKLPVPVDLVTASGSGLDPHISPAAAYYQVSRVARERGMTEVAVHALVDSHVEPRQFGFLGEPRVNVLELNLALDDISGAGGTAVAPGAADPHASETPWLRLPDWVLLALFIGFFVVTVVPLGRFMVRVIGGEPHLLSFVFDPVEQRVLAWSQVRAGEEMDWKTFALAMIVFSLSGIAFLVLLQLAQPLLPLNPAGAGSPPLDLALNTAVSFVTNTNWQAYAGETGMSYLTQMAGLTVQNFASAATGLAVLAGLAYGFSRRSGSTIGNFWALLLRSTFLLIPFCIILSLLLVSQGTVQTLAGPVTVPLLDPYRATDGTPVTTQTIPLGPAASQIAIKQLGVNGGGFFNANSAHPFENPTPFSNYLEMVAILFIPAALCYSFGRMIGAGRKGVSLLIAMTIIFLPLLGLAIAAETGGNPAFAPSGIDQTPSELQPGGNMEGKEVRFGIVGSTLFSVVTTAASCGAVNGMHDSFMPIGGFVQLFMMQLGEVVYGGIGSGLYGMIVFAIIAMFIAGLMVGRTPEYLGKKIEPDEMTIATIIILIPIILILVMTALAVLTDAGRAAVFNPGPHGFSEILYAFTSASQNNGSAFAGLSANTPFWTLATAFCMFVGRFLPAVLVLALAGSLVQKKIVPGSEGTLSDHRPLFILWLVFVVVIVGALSFLPALALGPIVEHLMLTGGV
ncbi:MULTISPECIES: potassium-transporting ATPase subunit KdpA [unclassified Methanoregula]|uniref:potassium-transporting ATPase subunit KdpA n=1 Tax=unclassified Methanoregula TaxID=2649730 RepID=UPI0009C98E39|nr:MULTISPECIES: potassium-transporting ATPase subunit KdpA [unclassified Methanoregula]OPX63193.1 MAG: potassium-transporting ATPase subunit A [Methanoregula sp. PtaB.Bin085]OPY33493.1 MAG: potassium-transporting ATPase subunit A [Methanoregula sp. PtaU1.Bin006]